MHVPEPRRHLVRYFGNYASVVRARQRSEADSGSDGASAEVSEPASEFEVATRRERRRRWASLIRRIYEVDPLTCSRCGQTMRILSFITERAVILRILRHLKLMPDARGHPC
jgi:hypothetical protein